MRPAEYGPKAPNPPAPLEEPRTGAGLPRPSAFPTAGHVGNVARTAANEAPSDEDTEVPLVDEATPLNRFRNAPGLMKPP